MGKPASFFQECRRVPAIHYDTFLDWSKAGGSKFARIQLDSLGMGYTKTGEVDQSWAAQWDQVFDKAQADGIYILPVFSGWFDWNAGSGYSTWKSNPLNQANGGPVKTPGELFQKGSATQNMWMNWMQSLVKRWQGRKNILAWEIFSEVNLASGTYRIIRHRFRQYRRSVDPGGRPDPTGHRLAWRIPAPGPTSTTALPSISSTSIPTRPQPNWTGKSSAECVTILTRIQRPVLIGESGLNAATPDSADGKITVAENARLGIQHAIWAAVVSGAMNGRALYWEDSFGIYFPNLGIPWMQKYETEELPAANFVNGVDFSGFQPLASTFIPGRLGRGSGK